MVAKSLSITAPRVELKDLERENNEMTPKERAKVVADIYGRQGATPEPPQLLEKKLAAMQTEIDQLVALNNAQTRAYQNARERLPDYVNSAEFRLAFLRSELFDSTLAAQKMIQYWKMKVRLFGEDTAFRGHRIQLYDLTDQDLATLGNEGLTFLPDKDEAGRSILVAVRQNWVYECKENVARVLFYLLQVIMDDEAMQRNGIVGIAFQQGAFALRENFDRKLSRLVIDVTKFFPLRTVALHYFYDDKILNIVLPILFFLSGRENRARYRIYYKLDRETRAQRLRECGISMDILPAFMGGGSQGTPESFLEAQRQAEIL